MKKIMFNDKYNLTEAVLSGRKTQTRRLIPQSVIDKAEQYRVDYFNDTLDSISLEIALSEAHTFMPVKCLSKYKVGDKVAVSQSYYDIWRSECLSYNMANEMWELINNGNKGMSNKMFVRAELMPHNIVIENIRVERLQDISEKDCISEGVIEFDDCFGHGFMIEDPNNTDWRRHIYTTARRAFASLIDKVSGKGTWDRNPYVFVYDFKLKN